MVSVLEGSLEVGAIYGGLSGVDIGGMTGVRGSCLVECLRPLMSYRCCGVKWDRIYFRISEHSVSIAYFVS